MKIRQLFTWSLAMALGLAGTASLSACSDDTNETETDANGFYVIPATVGEANYLLTSTTLDEGTITAEGNGYESVGAAYWAYKDTEVFGLVYNKGAAGTGASYYINADGKIEKDLEYTMSRFSTYGFWKGNIVTVSTGTAKEQDSQGNLASAFLFNELNTTDGSLNSSSKVCENMLGNGEKVTISGAVESNGKLFCSIVPTGMSKYGINKWPDKVLKQSYIAKPTYNDKGEVDNASSVGTITTTQYPDSAYVAIYGSDGFSGNPTILRTGKIGYATGRYRSQFLQTIWAADNGDIYVFSGGIGRATETDEASEKVTGKNVSGVMRIKAGENQFDDSYYVNLEEIGTKHPLHRSWHISGDAFLLQLFAEGIEGLKKGSMSADISELAIFHGESKQIVPITGLPSDATIGGEPYGEGNYLYLAVTVKSGDMPAFYKIDTATGKAVKGLTVKADGIKTAGKLKVKNQ